MSQKHLTIHERNKIEVLNKEGYSARKIATVLGFHHSTICREIKRCKDIYKATVAQAKRNELSKLKGRKKKITNSLKSTIETHLNKSWSSEKIVGRLLNGILSFKTIYTWIYSEVLDVDLNRLHRKGKSRKAKEHRGKFNIGILFLNDRNMSKKELNLEIGNLTQWFLLEEKAKAVLQHLLR